MRTIDEVRERCEYVAAYEKRYDEWRSLARLTLLLLDVYEHGALHTDDDPPCPDPKCKECAARAAVGRALEEMG